MPDDEATGISTRPTYSWSDADGSNLYLIEVANDESFTQIVDSAEVEGSSYASNAYNFTMGVPGSCQYGTTASKLFFDDVSGDLPWTVEDTSGDAVALWSRVIPPVGTGLDTRAWYARNSVNSSAD